MEKLAKRLAAKISYNLNYDKEKESVIAYGLIAIIQISLTFLIAIILGIILHVPYEVVTVCLVASILRKYSGGAHAGSAELCSAFSIIYCIVAALLSKHVLINFYSVLAMCITLIIFYLISFIIIYKLAPVDSPNKPIKTEKKRKQMRKCSFIALSIYLIISVAFLILSFKWDIFKSLGISILFALFWQTFSLTYPGEKFVSYINYLFLPSSRR